jgi:hypothetical protein
MIVEGIKETFAKGLEKDGNTVVRPSLDQLDQIRSRSLGRLTDCSFALHIDSL